MNGDLLVYRDGSPGCLRILGVPTLIANGAMAFSGVMLLEKTPIGVFLIALGVLGSAYGWVLLFSRTVVEIDRARRVATRTWSALFRLKRDEVPLDAFRTVALCRDLHRTRYRWIVSYAVELRGPSRTLRVRGALDEAPAHASALEVAAFAGISFEDARRPASEMIAASRLGGRAVVLIVVGTLIAVIAMGLGVALFMTQNKAPSARPPAHGRGRR